MDMAPGKRITQADILPMERYALERPRHRREVMELKRNRRLAVGPHATFHFENRRTMWYQIHEMCHIERGGEGQLKEEIDAYNPLIPQGRELVATVMFEISDPEQRERLLSRLGGVERLMSITVGETRVAGVPEEDLNRTSEDGKASSVQFVHFPFDDRAVADMRSGRSRVVVAIEHQDYGHMAVMPEGVRTALCADFDE